MPLDFKKERKDLYEPKTTPSIIDVPEMVFIAVDGKGDPNTSAEYAAAIEVLYGFSYTIKMGNKSVLEYVVPPLEGLWSVDESFFAGSGEGMADGAGGTGGAEGAGGAGEEGIAGTAGMIDKSKFTWTALIRQPDFVTPEVFEAAKVSLAKKKPELDTSKARLETITEGLCVQVMYIGSYDNEPATIAAMNRYAVENGYAIDISDTRRHHEIYLGDPRKVVPDKLKTIIRHPVRKAE